MSTSAALSVDVSEVRMLAQRWGRQADRYLMDELTVGFGRATQAAEREANALITGGAGSRLARSSRRSVRVSGREIEGRVEWTARSKDGFPYGVAVDRGRRGFGPVRAKALRFEVGGRVIFARWVRPARAQDFTGRGLERARPRIIAEIDGAVARWVNRMGAG